MPFPQPLHDELKELYIEHYRTIFKPLLAEVEIKFQSLPAPILNEVRSFNDHISRIYSDELEEVKKFEEIGKAKGHIRRAILDCFKFIDFYYHKEILKIEKKFKRCDWTTINNGKFYVEYNEKKARAFKSYRLAKKEVNSDFDRIFQLYQDAYNEYTALYDFVISNMHNLHWAQVKFGFKFWILIASVTFFTVAGGWQQSKQWYQYIKKEVTSKYFPLKPSSNQTQSK